MEQRVLGKTERQVSVIGLGTWQIGGAWGDVSEPDALGLLEASVDAGVTFFDTADVYGDGRSEKLIGRFLAANPWSGVTVATKMGRALEQVPENYVLSNFRRWVDRSRRNLGVDRLDLVQLHCPPTVVFSSDEVYDALTTLVEENLIEAYGVSVETCDQALTAISRRGTATVQIILNAFRLKPLEFVLPAAAEAGVGIIARVPLASGLLSGQYTVDTVFGPDDHRTYQPRRFVVRRRRDLLRRGLPDRCRGGRGVLQAGRRPAVRGDAGAGRAGVGRPAAGRDDGHPGRAFGRSGTRQRGCR